MPGGGGGHIADMVARYKANMSMLNKKRYFNKDVSRYDKNSKTTENASKHYSREEMQQLRKRLRKAKQVELITWFVILTASFICFLVIQMDLFLMLNLNYAKATKFNIYQTGELSLLQCQ